MSHQKKLAKSIEKRPVNPTPKRSKRPNWTKIRQQQRVDHIYASILRAKNIGDFIPPADYRSDERFVGTVTTQRLSKD